MSGELGISLSQLSTYEVWTYRGLLNWLKDIMQQKNVVDGKNHKGHISSKQGSRNNRASMTQPQ